MIVGLRVRLRGLVILEVEDRVWSCSCGGAGSLSEVWSRESRYLDPKICRDIAAFAHLFYNYDSVCLEIPFCSQLVVLSELSSL